MKIRNTVRSVRDGRRAWLKTNGQRAAALALALFFLTVVVQAFASPKTVYKRDSAAVFDGTESYSVILSTNDLLLQPFRLSGRISRVTLRMATYTEIVAQGRMTLQIRDAATGEILAENAWDREQLVDLAALVTETELPAGEYVLELRTEGVMGAPIALLSRDTRDAERMCALNGPALPREVIVAGEYPASRVPFPLLAAVGAVLLAGLFYSLGRRASFRITVFGILLTAAAVLVMDTLSLGSALRHAAAWAAAAGMWLGGPLLFARAQFRSAALRVLAALRSAWRIWAALGLGAAAGALAEWIVSSRRGQPFLWGRGAAFFAACFVLALFVLSWRRLLRSPEKCFAAVALPMALYLAAALPAVTGVSWDDQIHYDRTVFLSQGIYSVFSPAENGLSDLVFPLSLSETEQREINRTVAALDADGEATVRLSRKSLLPERIGYLPLVAGQWIGRLFSLPYPAVLILGRAAGAVAYVLLICLAMRKLRYGKLLLLSFGLLTTNLFQAASYSYDTWVTAFLAVGFAVFFSALQTPERPLTGRETAWMIGCIVIGCLPKGIYCFLLPALLLMPREKFADRAAHKRYCLWTCGLLAVMLVYCALPQAVDVLLHNGGGDTRGGSDVNTMGQLRSILADVPRYLGVVARFLRNYLAPKTVYGYTSVFAYVGGLNTAGWLMVPVLAAAVLDRGDGERFLPDRKPWLRLLGLGVILMQICAIVTVLYLVFTPVGSGTVSGCQPRYLLPLIFPALMFALHFGGRTRLPVRGKTALVCLTSAAGPAYVIWTLLAGQIVP